MKKNEELNALKKEFEVLNEKSVELTDEELKQVSGGGDEIRGKTLIVMSNKVSSSIPCGLTANGSSTEFSDELNNL